MACLGIGFKRDPADLTLSKRVPWLEIAETITLLVVNILIIGGALAGYFYFHQWIVAASVGGSGIALDVVGIAIICLTTCLKKRGGIKPLPEIKDGERSLTHVKWSEGNNFSRHVYVFKEGETPTHYLKMESNKSKKQRKDKHNCPQWRPENEILAYKISEALDLSVVPKTLIFEDGAAARTDFFEGNEAFSVLDTKHERVVIQEAVNSSTDVGAMTEEEKIQHVKTVVCETTSAHQAIFFSIVIGAHDFGPARFENFKVRDDKVVRIIDSEMMGLDFVAHLADRRGGEKELWLLQNPVADVPFSAPMKATILDASLDEIFSQEVVDKGMKKALENNLQHVQTIVKVHEGDAMFSPSLLADELFSLVPKKLKG